MKLRMIVSVLLVATLFACGGGGRGSDNGGSNTSSELVSIAITPSNTSVTVGSTQQFMATGTYSDNSTQDLTSTVTWTSSNSAVATVNISGLVTPVSAGLITLAAARGAHSGSTTLTVLASTSNSTPSSDPDIQSLSLSKTIEIANASRPEIIVTPDRVFILYLSISPSRSFNVVVYDRNMSSVVSTAVLVSTDPTYGDPTDIRVISDGPYLYAFYETCNDAQNKTYLFGAKYTLDDTFARTAYTGVITQSTKFTVAAEGDEKTDDPAPMVNGNEVYVMKRIKSTLAQSGATRYRLRKFSKNFQPVDFSAGVTAYDLDLSAYADGEARQASILFADGYYYVTVQTAVGPSSINNDNVVWTIPASLLMVRMDPNFSVKDSRIVSAEAGYTEGYVTGFKSDSKYFYLTYNHVKIGTEFSSVIKIFDKTWNEILTKKYASVAAGALRPSLEVSTNQVFAGNIDEAALKAMIYIFEKK
ncbi:MAG: Ig-like domain-containing protein [Nitrospirae bacterium]|nr:Ig-like domain-containing protein [Nitrospirota bacterium]